jgi:hypothetical protein
MLKKGSMARPSSRPVRNTTVAGKRHPVRPGPDSLLPVACGNAGERVVCIAD